MVDKNNNIISNRWSVVASLIIIGLIVLTAISLADTNSSSDRRITCAANETYDEASGRCKDNSINVITKQIEEISRQQQQQTKAELDRLKESGELCLTTDEAWANIGRDTCVAFYPAYMYMTNYGRLFLDEKRDYKNGFMAYFAYNRMISYADAKAKYLNGQVVAVKGKIVKYEGHLQVIVYSLDQVRTSPERYSCNISDDIRCMTSYKW